MGVLNSFFYCGESLPSAASHIAQTLQRQIGKIKDKYMSDDGSSVDYAAIATSSEFRTYVSTCVGLQEVVLSKPALYLTGGTGKCFGPVTRSQTCVLH